MPPCRRGVVILAGCFGVLPFFGTRSLAAQHVETRVIIANNVACRVEPARDGASVRRLGVGDMLFLGERSESSGEIWYRDRYKQCWVYAALTTEDGDPGQTLLTMADRILARTDTVSFEDYVAVHNLVRYAAARYGSVASYSLGPPIFDRSPLLQLRRLQLVDRASSAISLRTTREELWRDPLGMAWVFSNQDALRYFEPGDGWFVFADKYWDLYEQYQHTTWAEEMAWVAARSHYPRDECDGPCVLQDLARTHARYWTTYPNGRWVRDALGEAERLAAAGADRGCVWSSAEDARDSSDLLRGTLDKVEAPGKEEVLSQIVLIEKACGAKRN
jgi:hypothetical protein